MFDSLKKGISDAIRNLRGIGKITPKNIQDSVLEIKNALINADVNYCIVKELIDKISKEAVGTKVLSSLNPQQVFTKIVNDRLIEVMSCGDASLNVGNRGIVLLVGLQGAGKTTFAAKLGKFLKNNKKKRKPMLVACDVYRPAAIDQLEILSKENVLDFFKIDGEKDVCKIVKMAIQKAEELKCDCLIVDTAGRQTVDSKMMKELNDIAENFKIDETLLVLDAMIGQVSIDIAKKFSEAVNVTGFVLTKMDGDSKGGVALSVTEMTKKPIKFIGVGEKCGDVEVFHADRIANRILGKGDVVTLVERAEKVFEEEKKKDKSFEQFTFNELYDFFSMIGKVGGAKGFFDFMPSYINVSENKMNTADAFSKKAMAIIGSMTKKERALLCRIDLSRKNRIARGSGTTVAEVEQVIKTFDKCCKTMKAMKNLKGGLSNFESMFKK